MRILLTDCREQGKVLADLEMPDLPCVGDEIMVLGPDGDTYRVRTRRHVPPPYGKPSFAYYAVIGVSVVPPRRPLNNKTCNGGTPAN